MNSQLESISQMQAFIAEKYADKKRRNEQLWSQASRDAEHIISMIIKKYNPQAIYQWGSILERDNFTEISDIDIAVEGVQSAERFFALYGNAESMTKFPLDIVEMQHVEPEYVHLIKTYGKCVYSRVKEVPDE